LRAFCAEPIENDRDVAGILQGFAFTFELAWKVVQDEIERRGYAERGPRLSLAAGLRAGVVPAEDADAWSDALEDRNMVAHTYRPDWARDLAERVGKQYLPILERLAESADARAAEDIL
jgi:nucleotidyltransferase substrate binding protein (TIGR01987 family)